MEVREIGDKKIWEDFLLPCTQKTFLQYWNWGNFHISLGNKIWRLGIYENNSLIAVALVIKIFAKRGSFLLVPHGPVVMEHGIWNMEQILKTLLNSLQELAKQEKVDFIRISPIWERTPENIVCFKRLGFRTAPLHYHPESSWKLNIGAEENVLFDQMRKTTRYLLRQAQKDANVEIVKSTSIEDMKIFYDIHQEVVKVQKFVPFSLDYLTKELLAFLPDAQIAIFFAKYNGEIIAGAYEIFWSGIGFYHHAALLPKYKKIPVSYLLQWEAIKEAKKRGCILYDFWGYADPVKNPTHPYAGPTLFKMGFGGYKAEYVKTQDLVISQKYWINYTIETIRKIKRGL